MTHIIGYDLWFYVSHRLLHTRAGWWIHASHHEKVHPSWRDTYHGHWLESVIQSAGFAVPWLFGLWSGWAFVIALLLVNVRGMARHDRRTAWLIGNHHMIHHEVYGYNYGEYWLDWLCGTAWPHKIKRIDGWLRV